MSVFSYSSISKISTLIILYGKHVLRTWETLPNMPGKRGHSEQPGLSGVVFINMFTRSFYARRSPKCKKLLELTVFFALLESASIKVARNMLAKLTPDCVGRWRWDGTLFNDIIFYNLANRVWESYTTKIYLPGGNPTKLSFFRFSDFCC